MSVKRKAKSGPIRTALTAAAIIGAGVITGTLLALTPIFDETSSFVAPAFHPSYAPLLNSGSLVPPVASSSYRHHEPQPHVVHGVRPFNPAHINPTANL